MVGEKQVKSSQQGPVSLSGASDSPIKIEFYIPARPQPMAKFEISKKGGVYPRDKDGRKAAWKQIVALYAKIAMQGLDIFTGAVRLGIEIRLNQAKSNKKEYPTQKPDYSNFTYVIENTLQGIVYVDDCQVIGCLLGDKLWATPERPEGAYVTVEAVE